MRLVSNITVILTKHIIFLWFVALLQTTLTPSVMVSVIDTILSVNNREPIIEIKAIPIKCRKGLVNLQIERWKNSSAVIRFIYFHATHSFLGCRGVPCEDGSILVVSK